MPDAIKNSGLLVGTLGLVILSVLCVSCMHMLVNCAHTLGVRTRKPYMTYADVAEYSFSTSGPNARKLSKIARYVDSWLGVFLRGHNYASFKDSYYYSFMCTYFQDDNQYILMYNAIGILLCILRLCCSKLESGKYWNNISTYKVDFKIFKIR